MGKNFFRIAFRNLRKNSATGFINLFGLSIGMSAAVFIFLWIQSEISHDGYQPGKETIFRVSNSIQVSKEEVWKWETAPLQLADFALKEIPEVQQACKLSINSWSGPVFNINNKLFSEKTSAYVDKGWFNMFHYDFVAGNVAAFNQNPFSIILTETKAKKYFGDSDAMGQVIRVDTISYTVQGVVKDNPVNSSFQFDILLQLDGRLSDPGVFKNDKNWNNFGYITFLKLNAAANEKQVTVKLNDILNAQRKENTATASLQPLNKMYFESDLQSSEMPHGSKKAVYIFTVLAFLLLITACINYVNITTAKASLRAKEVSVRKIVGAQRQHLFFQFIAESLTISLLALVATLVLIQLCLPAFNAVTEKSFVLVLSSITMWEVLLGTLFFATILNGIYPAMLLSSFKPLNVFRGRSVLKVRDGAIRKGLVVFQFALSMILIIGTTVITRQLKYIQTSNPGYNVSQVISVQVPFKSYWSLKPEARAGFFEAMKQDLKSQSSIGEVSNGSSEIVDVKGSSSGNADWDGRDTAYNPTIAHLTADAAFQKMFGLQLKAGRWFSTAKDDEHNYILNETATELFKMYQPLIGQRFTWGGDTGKVIGVVKDFHYKNMHEKIGPMVLSNNEGHDAYFFIKTVPGNIPQALRAAEKTWAKFIPAEPLNYTFLDDSFTRLYKSDIRTSQLIFIFSLIAIIISALGLFGLAAFTAEQRTKEIGIRKVLGASVKQIAALLSQDFVKLVIIAIVIASPVAWWAMEKWLQDFAYRINISASIFIMAGSIALLIAVISVSFQAIKAAVANPVKSLRTE